MGTREHVQIRRVAVAKARFNADHRQLPRLDGTAPPGSEARAEFSPDGSRVLTACSDRCQNAQLAQVRDAVVTGT